MIDNTSSKPAARQVGTEHQPGAEHPRLAADDNKLAIENKRLRAALEWVRDNTELWDAPIVLDALAGAREDEPEQAHRSKTTSP